MLHNKWCGHLSDSWIAAALTTVALGGHGFSNQLHPPPAFLPIFDYPINGALSRWRRPAPPTLSFKNPLQKTTGDVTDTKSIFFTVYAVQSLLYIVANCNFFSVVTWKDIIKYLQKCKGCTHFCEILYLPWCVWPLTSCCILWIKIWNYNRL